MSFAVRWAAVVISASQGSASNSVPIHAGNRSISSCRASETAIQSSLVWIKRQWRFGDHKPGEASSSSSPRQKACCASKSISPFDALTSRSPASAIALSNAVTLVLQLCALSPNETLGLQLYVWLITSSTLCDVVRLPGILWQYRPLPGLAPCSVLANGTKRRGSLCDDVPRPQLRSPSRRRLRARSLLPACQAYPAQWRSYAGCVQHALRQGLLQFQIRAVIRRDRKSTRLNSSHVRISYAV